ncbi:hypothetical protein DRO69_04795 [Candidatus Bathyarchaeota archaeon]|nr:MAG: hypothetical protein DRO69_04795 [Candidatus Bathyarchaeota archaeon]
MKFDVLIVGCGAQGSVIVSELIKHPEVGKIKVADVDFKKAKKIAERINKKKISAYKVDAHNINEIAALSSDVDLIVNAVIPRFNLNIMHGALKSGANYLDLAFGPPYNTLESQLKLHRKFQNADLTALICAGSAPGITNVLIAHAAEKLNSLDRILIRIFDHMQSKKFILTWSPETLLGDMAENPIIYQNGKYIRVPTFSEEEIYNFPEPIGEQTVYAHVHEEVLTIPHFIGKDLRYMDLKLGGPDMPIIKSMVELGICSTKPIDVNGVKVTPLDVLLKLLPPTLSLEELENMVKTGVIIDAYECYVVTVEGTRLNKKITYKFIVDFPKLREVQKWIPGATHESYVTGVSAAIFAKLLGEGKIKDKGVISTECLDRDVRETFLATLGQKGVKISQITKKQLN